MRKPAPLLVFHPRSSTDLLLSKPPWRPFNKPPATRTPRLPTRARSLKVSLGSPALPAFFLDKLVRLAQHAPQRLVVLEAIADKMLAQLDLNDAGLGREEIERERESTRSVPSKDGA
jgi:hypothetical protein